LAHSIDLKDAITLDLEETATRLSSALREAVERKLRRRGLVVAISGGIDSACVAALAVRALGPKRVFGLMLPERDSSPESTRLGRDLANALGITFEFDPYFGLSISRVDPLPHQLEAVYDYLLKLPQVRFLFADDLGVATTGRRQWTLRVEGRVFHVRPVPG